MPNASVLILIRGKPATELQNRLVSFQFSDTSGKRRDSAKAVFEDRDRRMSVLLSPDDVWKVAWGFPSRMSKTRLLRVKGWSTSYDDGYPQVSVELKVTGTETGSEPHSTHKARTWGKTSPSFIAREIAERHRLTPDVTVTSGEYDDEYVQPAHLSDYGYLAMLAGDMAWEFFIDGSRLVFRPRTEDRLPFQVFSYMPKNGEAPLLSFSPEVKVVRSSVKPTGADTKNPGPQNSGEGAERASSDVLAAAAASALGAASVAGVAMASVAADAVQKQAGEYTVDPEAIAASKKAKELLGSAVKSWKRGTALADAAKAVSAGVEAVYSKVVNSDAQGVSGVCSSPTTSPSGDVPIGKPSQPSVILGLDDARSISVVDGSSAGVLSTPATSPEKRKQQACAEFTKMVNKAVTASVKVVGDAALEARRNYRFVGVGDDFSGVWYSTEITHTIDSNGYITEMKVKRGTLRTKRSSGTATAAGQGGDSKRVSNSEPVVMLSLGDSREKTVKTGR